MRKPQTDKRAPMLKHEDRTVASLAFSFAPSTANHILPRTLKSPRIATITVAVVLPLTPPSSSPPPPSLVGELSAAIAAADAPGLGIGLLDDAISLSQHVSPPPRALVFASNPPPSAAPADAPEPDQADMQVSAP